MIVVASALDNGAAGPRAQMQSPFYLARHSTAFHSSFFSSQSHCPAVVRYLSVLSTTTANNRGNGHVERIRCAQLAIHCPFSTVHAIYTVTQMQEPLINRPHALPAGQISLACGLPKRIPFSRCLSVSGEVKLRLGTHSLGHGHCAW